MPRFRNHAGAATGLVCGNIGGADLPTPKDSDIDVPLPNPSIVYEGATQTP